MSGETEANVSGWTTDTLRSYLESVIQQHDRRFVELLHEKDLRDSQRFEAQQLALRDALCVSADTPVLCADLIWRPAGDLLPGDELVTFDETGSPYRSYRKGIVTSNECVRDALLRVNTDRGSVRCTYDHPFLVRRRGRSIWVRADDLRPGDSITHMLDPWEVDRSYDAGWLAGILDGEGCLTFHSSGNGSAKISLGQVPDPVADTIDKMLKSRGIMVSSQISIGREGVTHAGRAYRTQPQQRWAITRRPDILRVLGSIRPVRLLEHADQVWEGFWIRAKDRTTSVVSVEPVGSGLVASLSTSTHTYIAAGFAMHNTAQEKAVNAALLAAQTAVQKAETAAERRFEAVNEFRGQLADQAANLMPRGEANVLFAGQSEKITALEARINESAGRSKGIDQFWGYLVGGVGLVLAILAATGKL